MTKESEALDITNAPDLTQLADEVRRYRRPQVWRCNGENVAILMPLTEAKITPVPKNPALDTALAGLPEDSVVRRTAGALHTDQPFLGYDVEKELAELAIALDVIAALVEQQHIPELVSFDRNYDRIPGIRRVEP